MDSCAKKMPVRLTETADWPASRPLARPAWMPANSAPRPIMQMAASNNV